MHMWATTHNLLEKKTISEFDQIKMKQGYEVEELAKLFIENTLLPRYPHAELLWQKTYIDGEFQCRADALIYDKDNQGYDVYEIKSSTKVDPENEKDLTFQTLIYENNFSVRNVNIIHLNKEYVRNGEIDLEDLFVVKELNESVNSHKIKVLNERREALRINSLVDSAEIEACTTPSKCPCMSLCHPDLPPYSIYELMNKNKKKLLALRDLGVLSLVDVPDDFKINDKQLHQIESVKFMKPFVDSMAISTELQKLTFPIYFLDYETFGLAIPQFDGYKPQQNMVFQYSLHKVEEDGTINHFEYLSITKDDPSLALLDQLKTEIGPVGSVVVWNKTFECGRNEEMAERYPQHKEFLESVNERIYDLADSIKFGYLIHPDFHGSWSIKKVLPVLVPSLSYKDLEINKGDQASSIWLKLVSKLSDDGIVEADWISDPSDGKIQSNMLKYCELDTLAMVEVWKYLSSRIQSEF